MCLEDMLPGILPPLLHRHSLEPPREVDDPVMVLQVQPPLRRDRLRAPGSPCKSTRDGPDGIGVPAEIYRPKDRLGEGSRSHEDRQGTVGCEECIERGIRAILPVPAQIRENLVAAAGGAGMEEGIVPRCTPRKVRDHPVHEGRAGPGHRVAVGEPGTGDAQILENR